MECKISQNLRGGGTSRLKSLVICFTLTLVALIFFGATKTLAIASEDSSNESTPKIDWGFTDSNSLIPIPQQMSNSSVGEAASVVNDVNLSATPVGQVAMYRLYNPYSGEHFYTSDKTERDGLIKIGWKNENIGWVAPTTSNTPVYRLYNSYSEGGDHHYTASKKEYDDLKKAGWTQEGVCWYSVDFDSVYKAAIYRQYNPNQFSCNHNYTIDTKERDTLLKAGWNDEGISYYGLDFSKMAELDFSKFTVDTSNKTYKGDQFKPSVTSTKYKAGTDYIVTYGENKNVGTGTITIQGTGAYYGSKTYTFKINQKVISSVNWSATQFKYTGKPQAPTATAVGLCGKDVANVTVVASGEHIKTGTYVASATAISNKNYKLANIKTNYKIIPATIDFEGKNEVTADTSDETYTGNEITKDISVAGLVEGKDFEVIYENNVDAGTATVTIKGIGDYEGETSFTFEIKPISLDGATVVLGDALTYNGQTQTQEVSKVTVKVNGKEMEVPSSALTISNNTGKDADAYEMTVSASGNFTGSTTQPFSIAKKKLTYECEKDTFEYDKETHVPTLKLNGAVEGETVDYSVSILSGSKNTLTAVESAVNAGDYAVSPSLQGDSAKNYELNDGNKTFSITKKKLTFAWDVSSYTYDKVAHAPNPTINGVLDGETVEFSVSTFDDDDQEVETAVTAGNYKVVPALSKEYDNYELADGQEQAFAIERRHVSVSGIKAKDKDADGTTDAKLDFSGVVFGGKGKVDGDDLKVTGKGKFETAEKAKNQKVTISELTLTGKDAENYVLDDSDNTATASIWDLENYAVYSSDGVVRYYHRMNEYKPNAGDALDNGATATAVIDNADQTGISTLSSSYSPTAVEFVDEIEPTCSAYNLLHSGAYSKIASVTGFENLKLTNMTDLTKMFYSLSALKELDLTNLDTSKVTNMSYMFASCTSLTSLDLTPLNTCEVTDMSHMFEGANLASVNLETIKTSKVTDMSSMFASCPLESIDLHSFDTKNVTNMSEMFCHYVKGYNGFSYSAGFDARLNSLDLSAFDTSKVTNMDRMFAGNTELTTLIFGDGFKTSNVTNMGSMFALCESLTQLDVSDFDTHNVEVFCSIGSSSYGLGGGEFKHCHKCTAENNYLIPHTTSCSYSNCVRGCSGGGTYIYVINKYSVDDTAKYCNLDYSYGKDCGMFYGCKKLTSLDVSNFNVSKAKYLRGMFTGCSSLTSLDLSSWYPSKILSSGRYKLLHYHREKMWSCGVSTYKYYVELIDAFPSNISISKSASLETLLSQTCEEGTAKHSTTAAVTPGGKKTLEG